ncbi:MAG: zinc ribbon domain-containing protein [Thermoplasmata archaeon]|nr:zinc ribbon domain-containing protein [Thermoplasmata archaeon]
MAGMDKCPVCGSEIGKGAEACDTCGTAFDEIPSKCPLCDAEVDDSATECPSCGAEMDASQKPVPDTDIDEVEIAEMPSEVEKETAELIASDVFVDVELEELVKLSGVGPLKAKILYDSGFTNLRKLKQASVVELMNIRGIGRKAAGEIKAALRESSLEEIRETELTKETVEAEYQCPLCETIVSAYETSCYECGCIFEPGAVADEDSDRLALSYYDSKLLREPDNKDLWYARGATLIKMEEYDQALNSFNRSLDIDKSFQSAWMSKAEVYNKLGDSTKAAECYSHIISSASGKALGADSEDDDDFLDDDDISEVKEIVEPEIVEKELEDTDASEETIVPTESSKPDDSDIDLSGDEDDDDEPEEELVVEEEPEEEPVTEEIPEEEIEDTAELPEVDDTESLSQDAAEDTEPVIEKYPDIEDSDDDDLELEAPPPPEAAEPEEPPEVMKPHSTEDISSGLDINMDYTRPEPDKLDLDSMSETDMKKYLSQRASYVKPYLALAKELDVNINHAKKLIARAVGESKKGELKLAIEVINEGIEYAEAEFHNKVSKDMEELASVIRDLKMTGIDVSGAVDFITESKRLLEEGEIIKSVEKLRVCLEHIETIAA